jgi:two-component system, chemotaxis family, response regulator Rcp1
MRIAMIPRKRIGSRRMRHVRDHSLASSQLPGKLRLAASILLETLAEEELGSESSRRRGGNAWEAVSTAPQILLVEDNPGDVLPTREAFWHADPSIEVYVVSDGAEAMAFLRREGRNADAPRPDFILLDLNLPKMRGCEVLAQIKGDRDLRTIPVAILTSSGNEADIARSYELHANCYLNKPTEFDGFKSLMESITDFWLTRVELPRKPGGTDART